MARSSQDSLASPNLDRTRCTVEGWMPSRKPILAGPHRRLTLIAMIRRSRRTGVRCGELTGRLERSCIPSSPWSR